MRKDSSPTLQTHVGFRPLLDIYTQPPHLRVSNLNHHDYVMTVRSYVKRAHRLMEIRIVQWYDEAADEVKQRWQKDADAFLQLAKDRPLLPSMDTEEGRLIQELHDALELQRRRERQEAHLVSAGVLDIWMTAMTRAEAYLNRDD